MANLSELAETLSKLSLVEAVELKNLLKGLGIEPAAGGGGGGAVAAVAGPVAKAEEPTEFNVILESVDPAKKINVIKVVRELTGQGLAEAKATVEGAPKAIKENADKKTAEDVKKKLDDAGGKAVIKPV
jgi:large subunit ribosomal protein L7/L12